MDLFYSSVCNWSDFLPDTGKLEYLKVPSTESYYKCRIETGVREGDLVSVYYDPMIAKLVVWAQDRPTALRKLQEKLEEYQVNPHILISDSRLLD